MPESEAAAWTPAPRLAVGVGSIPPPSRADGAVATWPTNDGRELVGLRVGGVGWLLLPGVAGYRLDRAAVTAVPDGGTSAQIEEAWVRSVLPLAVQERGTQVLHASALAGPAWDRRAVRNVHRRQVDPGRCARLSDGARLKPVPCAPLHDVSPEGGDGARPRGDWLQPVPETSGAATDGRVANVAEEVPTDAPGACLQPRPSATTPVRLVADDALAFTVESDAVLAHPLPFRLRLRPTTQRALGLPELAAQAVEPGPSAPLSSLVLLDPHGEDDAPTLEPVSPAEALGALMPHAYCFALEEGKEELVAAYAALVERVPVQRLSYPQRIERIGEAVDELRALLA